MPCNSTVINLSNMEYSRVSSAQNTIFRDQNEDTYVSLSRGDDQLGGYELHPEIVARLKVEKGSLENFVKPDDLDQIVELEGKYDSNFIVGKIDRTGNAGRRARAEIQRKESEKLR